jgi:hypothetical protein
MRVCVLALLLCACPAPRAAPEEPTPKPASPVPEPDADKVRIYPPVQVRKAATKYTLEVLGIELVGKVNPVGTMAAVNLTNWIRKIADDDLFITVGRRNLDMLDAKVLAGCGDDEAACVKQIATALGVDRLLYGIVNDFGGEFYVSLTMLDAASGKTTTWTGNSYAGSRDTEYTAKVALDAIIRRMP